MSKINYRAATVALFILACACVCPSSARARAYRLASPEVAADWLSIRPEGEEFAVSLPEPPVSYSSWTAYTDFFNSLMKKKRARVYGASGDGLVFVVMSFKGYGRDKGSPDKVIKSFMEAFRKELAARSRDSSVDVTSERGLSLDAFSGMQYRVSINGVPGVVRCYVAKEHLYILEAMGGDENNTQVQKFFSSFTLGDEPAASAAKSPAASAGPQPKGPDAGTVFGSSEVDRKALIVLRREAVFSDEARRRGASGVVAVRAVLSASGEVTNVEVVRGAPHGLNEMAMDATREIKFVPALKNDRPVSQRVVIEYAFNSY